MIRLAGKTLYAQVQFDLLGTVQIWWEIEFEAYWPVREREPEIHVCHVYPIEYQSPNCTLDDFSDFPKLREVLTGVFNQLCNEDCQFSRYVGESMADAARRDIEHLSR